MIIVIMQNAIKLSVIILSTILLSVASPTLEMAKSAIKQELKKSFFFQCLTFVFLDWDE